MSELIDNRARRIASLKSIIGKLHKGTPAGEVRDELKQIVRETDYSEIVAMEQELIAEGMPVEEIKSMCDLHSQVTRDVLVQLAPPPVAPGHPVDTFRRENAALRESAARLSGEAAAGNLLGCRQALNELMDIEKHYQRKENALFSCLERHGITGPSKVMWAKDDEVRGKLKDLALVLGEGGPAEAIQSAAQSAADAVLEMIYKEENILLPMALGALTADEWAEIWHASPRYGWCLVEPREGYKPAEPVLPEGVALRAGQGVQLPTGNLTIEQLTSLFASLPVDVTFVDAEDRVRFFSEGPSRVFARTRAILGRKVQHCHPPKSVDVVDQIVGSFRDGSKDVAEFWIELHGRFVHIRYFAVRDEEKRYLGTLEVTQDVTGIRALQGERRLLEWEAEKPSAAPAPAPERFEFDADEMLKKGEHPLAKVQACSAQLAAGESILIRASFRPAPLIAMFESQGFRVTCTEAGGRFETVISKA
jgi:hypothetical protein